MKFYVHPGLDYKITNSPKTDCTYCAIGPFETMEEAQDWVEHNRTFFVVTTATDVRVKVQPRTKVKES